MGIPQRGCAVIEAFCAFFLVFAPASIVWATWTLWEIHVDLRVIRRELEKESRK